MTVFPFSRRDEKYMGAGPDDGIPTEQEIHDVVDEGENDLHRDMKPRQLSIWQVAQHHTKARHINVGLKIAIAGAIGTGLIIGTSGSLAHGGPGSLLIGYIILGFVIYVVMVALGEMAAWLPHKKSFSGYASRFVDPAMGFATGWNYFFKYVIICPNNLTASGIIIQYWRPDINVSVWIVVFGVCVVALNLIHVAFFGEAEFWMSLVKALVIVMLILLCFIIALGGGPNHHRTGFRYWQDPGAFAEYLQPGALGRFLGVWNSLVQATFSYIGTELVGVAFGEAPDPRRNVPRAVNQTLIRIVLFYVVSVLVLGMAVPYNSPDLITASSAKASGAASAFTIAAKNAGISKLADAVNGLLLVFTISAANSDIYLASRSIWALAKDRQAPQLFQRTNRRGVPVPAVALASVFIALGFMNATKSSSTVFGYFVSLVTVFGALNWMSILLSYLAMNHAMRVQGVSRSVLPYRNILLPWGAYVALFITALIIIFSGFAAFMPTFQVDKFITSYIGIVVYVGNVLWWKVFKKTRRVRLKEVDLITGRRE